MPKSRVRWFFGEAEDREILNNSVSKRGEQTFLVFDRGGFEKTSTLVLTNVQAEDSGQYMCVTENQAGKAEANFTLQVSCFILLFQAVLKE